MALKGSGPRKAEHGQKMIGVKVRFFTNGIAAGESEVMPKRGWTRGVVRFERNDVHGLKDGDPSVFNSLMELPSAIEKLLIRGGVMLHAASPMKKYIA